MLFLLFSCRCHEILGEELLHGQIFQLPISHSFHSIGSFGFGFLGNPIGGLHFWISCLHPIHPWHKCLDWSPPKSKIPILRVILDLKIERKKTLVRDKLFWNCLAYLQSDWDFLGLNQSSQFD